jgi:hypothetical protein
VCEGEQNINHPIDPFFSGKFRVFFSKLQIHLFAHAISIANTHYPHVNFTCNIALQIYSEMHLGNAVFTL